MPQNGRIIVDRIPIVTVGNLTQKCDILGDKKRKCYFDQERKYSSEFIANV